MKKRAKVITKKNVKRYKETNRKIKIGLALGKGAARGFAHIGVLKVLEENDIKPDLISGCSAGSVIAGLYASGMNPRVIEKSLTSINWKEMFDFVMPKKGLIKGQKLEHYLELLTQNKEFRDLDMPLYIVATNITKKKKALFHEGNVAKAMRASIAIPGIFDPVLIGGDNYVDGGLVDPVPVDILREQGADLIIAVDLTSEVPEMIVSGKNVRSRHGFTEVMREKLVIEEINFIKEFLKAKEMAKRFIPRILRNFFHKLKVFIIDRFIKPTMVFRYFSKSQFPEILSMMYDSIDIMEDEFTKAKLHNGNSDVVISPTFTKGGWTDMDKADYFIKRGAMAASKKIKEIKDAIKQAKHHH